MKICLTENGICVPDVKLLEFAENSINKGEDVEIGNDILFYAFRVIAKRKQLFNLEWFIYGKKAAIDKNFKLSGCYDPKLYIGQDILLELW